MKICLIVGSQRDTSESLKVAQYIAQSLQDKGMQTSMIVLSDHALPRYDNNHNPDVTPELWKPFAEKLSAADSFVIVTPEWGGMVPGELKNLFLWCKAGEMANKPALITAVSSGTGGAYPVAELRMSSYKNTKICYIPDHLIVRHVNSVLDATVGGEDDVRIRTRIAKTLDVFLAYTRAFMHLRSDETMQHYAIGHGM